MRVLHLGKFFPPFAGGIEHFLAALLSQQRQSGLDTAALVHGHNGHNGVVEIYRASPIYRAPCLGRLLYAPVSPNFLHWLQRVLREFQPQLIHLHMPNTSAFWLLSSPSARRLPWLVHWHADVVTSRLDRRLNFAYRAYRPFEQALLRRSAAVIATSPPYLEASPALAPWRQRCRVIPLGLDPTPPAIVSSSAAAAESLWGEGLNRVFTLGRLTYYKGHEILIQAAAQVPQLRLVIAGTGERRERLQNLIDQLQLGQRVSLLGYIEQDLVEALLASCDLFCLPSLERTEAFGVVLLEAMRHAKPLVVSDIPGSGTGWVVNTGPCGILVPPGNIDKLAAALSQLASTHLQRTHFGRNGLLVLKHHFSIEQIAEQTAALYREILG